MRQEQVLEATQLYATGYYRKALDVLGSSPGLKEPPAIRLLRAELLTITGRSNEATLVLESVAAPRILSERERSYVEWIRARISKESGSLETEASALRKCLMLAERAGDLERVCWAQLRLIQLTADVSGHESTGPMMMSLRANVTRLGDPIVTAALHLTVGQLEGKRGLTTVASHHCAIAAGMLRRASHVWLEAWCHIDAMAISIIRNDFDLALKQGRAALEASEASGYLWGVHACLGNLGYVLFCRGDFDAALNHYDLACSQTTTSHEQVFAIQENQGRVYFAKGQLDLCANMVAELDRSSTLSNEGRYFQRHALLLKSELMARLGNWSLSLACTEELIGLATNARDEHMAGTAVLLKAEVLGHLHQWEKAWRAVESLNALFPRQTRNLLGRYERTVASLLAMTGDSTSGSVHRELAERIVDGLRNIPEKIELERSWNVSNLDTGSAQRVIPVRVGANIIQSLSALLIHVGLPEFVAAELVSIVRRCECASAAAAISRDEGGIERTISSYGELLAESAKRVFPIGTAQNKTIDVIVQPLPDFESLATVNSIAMLLATVRDLEQAKLEREERLTLWPSDELPLDDENAIVMGKMRELMSLARKIAPTNVPVLITGESGTGKEVLARAIHAFSSRAKKPFVPLNCTAVPRELLESQLFGHRRGAFTGADRDNLGVVRAAKDGTLFLDEIGEMSLELQPKLLRFLESGEVSPLGEPSPFTVDVRIVAATNANLDHLVEHGRFREDLFYRLNVICLAIPPLRERRDEIPSLTHHFVAKAATEFKKGRMRVAEETMETLVLFPWPGNVRQLQNELRRMVALADADSVLMPGALAKGIRQSPAPRSAGGPQLSVGLNEKLPPAISRIEREMIQAALRANRGHVEATARALGISRKGLYLKRQRLKI